MCVTNQYTFLTQIFFCVCKAETLAYLRKMIVSVWTKKIFKWMRTVLNMPIMPIPFFFACVYSDKCIRIQLF